MNSKFVIQIEFGNREKRIENKIEKEQKPSWADRPPFWPIPSSLPRGQPSHHTSAPIGGSPSSVAHTCSHAHAAGAYTWGPPVIHCLRAHPVLTAHRDPGSNRVCSAPFVLCHTGPTGQPSLSRLTPVSLACGPRASAPSSTESPGMAACTILA